MNIDLKQLKRKAKEATLQTMQSGFNMLLPKEQPENLNKSAFTKLYERFGLAEFLPYKSYDEDGVWVDDKADNFGSYMLGYEVSPIIRAGVDTAEAIAEMMRSPDMPIGTVIYSLEEANNDIAPYMGAYCVSQKQGHDEMFRRLANYRTNFMTSYADGEINPLQVSGFRPRTIKYYLAVKIPSPKGSLNEKSFVEFQDKVLKVDEIVNNMQKGANIGVVKLSGESLVKLIDHMLNPAIKGADLHTTKYDDQPLNQQLARKESEVNLLRNGYLRFKNSETNEEIYGAAMSVAKFGTKGEPYFISQTGDATGKTYKTNDYLPGNFIAYSIIEKLDDEKIETELNGRILKGMEGDKWVEGRAMNFFSRKSQEVKQSVGELHKQVVDNHLGAVKVTSGLILYAKGESELASNISKAKKLYTDSKLTMHQEKNITFPVWLNHTAGFFQSHMDGIETGLCRAVTMNCYNAASMFHVQGDWRGIHPIKGGILSICRKGELACISPFHVFKSNYNFILAADSGSGKSFLVNELAKSARSTGGKIRIIDIGRSYEQSCETMGGKNIIFEHGKGICMNFFSEIYTKEDLLESKETLITLVASMCFPRSMSNSDFNDEFELQLASLEHAIDAVWDEIGCEMSIYDIFIWLRKAYDGDLKGKSSDNFDLYVGEKMIKDMVILLRKWAVGDYSKWFVGKCNLNFDNDFLVLELEELKSKPDLQSVVMNYIVAKIEHEIYLGWKENPDSTVRKQTYVIIDEAWALLAQENTAAFMEEAARRFRKYEACMGLATQSFMDPAKNSAGRAFCQNVNHIIALKTNITAVEKAVKEGIIEVEPYQHKWIKSLDKTDDYSEFFWINKSLKSEGLYRFVVDPVTAYIYTSTGEERDMIKGLMDKGLSRMDAIERLANEKVNLSLWASKRLDQELESKLLKAS